jgi:exopolysaccharide biosynthesis WecB/TagA/CpsF family protein
MIDGSTERRPSVSESETLAPEIPTMERNVARFLGLDFCNLTLEEASSLLIDAALTGTRHRAYFVNAHCFNVAARDAEYRKVLAGADCLFADGIGMALAARLWDVRLCDNVNGTDLFPLICRDSARRGIPLAMVGGRPGIAERCAERMCSMYPGLSVVLTRHGYLYQEKEAELIEDINRSGARILLVAKGVPLQERWIDRHAPLLSAPVLLGVGALFDFYSGTIPRAPLSWRRAHLEWLFRLTMEPRRMFGRYVIGNPMFLVRALHCRMRERRAILARPPLDEA